jgi:hypothetical protein
MASDTNVSAPAGTFRVQMDEGDYRLVGPGDEEGPLVEYGQPAALVIGSAVYYTLVEDPDSTSAAVYRVDTVTPVDSEVQDVEFEYPEDDEEGADEEEPDDGEPAEDDVLIDDEPPEEEPAEDDGDPEEEEEEEEPGE